MATVNTDQFTSAAYVFSALSSNFDTKSNDPRSNREHEQRYCRAILVVTAGSLHVIDAEGTTVDIADALPSGTVVPIQAKTVLASSGTTGVLVLY